LRQLGRERERMEPALEAAAAAAAAVSSGLDPAYAAARDALARGFHTALAGRPPPDDNDARDEDARDEDEGDAVEVEVEAVLRACHGLRTALTPELAEMMAWEVLRVLAETMKDDPVCSAAAVGAADVRLAVQQLVGQLALAMPSPRELLLPLAHTLRRTEAAWLAGVAVQAYYTALARCERGQQPRQLRTLAQLLLDPDLPHARDAEFLQATAAGLHRLHEDLALQNAGLVEEHDADECNALAAALAEAAVALLRPLSQLHAPAALVDRCLAMAVSWHDPWALLSLACVASVSEEPDGSFQSSVHRDESSDEDELDLPRDAAPSEVEGAVALRQQLEAFRRLYPELLEPNTSAAFGLHPMDPAGCALAVAHFHSTLVLPAWAAYRCHPCPALAHASAVKRCILTAWPGALPLVQAGVPVATHGLVRLPLPGTLRPLGAGTGCDAGAEAVWLPARPEARFGHVLALGDAAKVVSASHSTVGTVPSTALRCAWLFAVTFPGWHSA
jgi:hypothetical protein